VFHLFGDRAYFLGSKAPKFRIVRLGRHHLIDLNLQRAALASSLSAKYEAAI
jgi:hypothetical protein